jgi:hypothetical protein
MLDANLPRMPLKGQSQDGLTLRHAGQLDLFGVG